MAAPVPVKIKLHRRSRQLELVYEDTAYELPAEYLRVYSPSAEVKGHGKGQEVLQTGKQMVAINSVEPQGNYAIKLTFSDGHDSGIYSWQYLYELSTHYQTYWDDYLKRLQQAGKTRNPDESVVRLIQPQG